MSFSFSLPLPFSPVPAGRRTLLGVSSFDSQQLWRDGGGSWGSYFHVLHLLSQIRTLSQDTIARPGHTASQWQDELFLLHPTAYLVDHLFPFYVITVLSK